MELLGNFNLLFTGAAVAGIAVTGFTVFLSNKKSITNKSFFIFTIAAIFWNISNYLISNIINSEQVIWVLRSNIFFAVWYCFGLFQLFLVFPKEKFIFHRFYKFFFVPFIFFISIITLSPFTFSDIAELSLVGQVNKVNNGPGIFIFGITVASLISAGLFVLLRKLSNKNGQEAKQIKFILLGFTITFSLHIFFNFLLPAFYNNPNFIQFGSLYTFPLIAFTAYTILKYKLFNIKVAGISLLVFALSIVTFGEVIFADNLSLIIYRSSIFVLVLIIGINLIRGVLREVSLREKLQEANVQQERLIHFITHQIKGFFTVSRNIFAEVLTGDYGQLPPEVKPLIEKGLNSDTEGVRMVEDVLNAASMKTGKIKYDLQVFDIRILVEKIIASHRKEAMFKKLDYQVDIGNESLLVKGDSMQLEHALGNLVDNAIKYTPSGIVKISLKKEKDKIVYSVKDSGIGIAPEDMPKLFKEGGRGKNAKKVNVQSTGYGLYISKQIVEANNGQIRLESKGEGKGTTFIIELPAA